MDVDEIPIRHAYGTMPGVLEDWYEQGLPRSVKDRNDFQKYFGFPSGGKSLPLSMDFDPPFEAKVIEDTAEYQISIDRMGRRMKVLKQYATIPRTHEFPVRDMETWKDFKRRLVFHPGRAGDELEKIAEENRKTGHLNTFGGMGFYWFPRDLMGDEALCIAYYEMPELVADILETWCFLYEQVLSSALERIRLDSIGLAEDMAYKNGSMIGKSLFDKFMLPYYLRIKKLVDKYEIPVFAVDTDGSVEELIYWFRDCGVNLLGPNEVMAGNNIVSYRKQFQKTMAFDGGLNKLVLPKGKEAIERMLQSIVPYMKDSGGGWIACLDHRIVRETSLSDFTYYIDRLKELVIM